MKSGIRRNRKTFMKITGFCLVILCIFVITTMDAEGARWIDDHYDMIDGEVCYLRWDNAYHPISEMNIETGEWSYFKTEDINNIYLRVDDDVITLPKEKTTFKFDKFKISPTITYTQSEIDKKSKKDIEGKRYLKIPFYTLKGVKKTTKNTLHVGKFTFYTGNSHITIKDSVGTILNHDDYDFQIKNNQICLYYNTMAMNALIGDISFEMHSWQTDTSIISGLSSVSDQSGVDSMYLGDVLHLLISHDDKVPEGHHWTGSAWTVNTTITAGLSATNIYLMETFYMDSTWYYLTWLSIGGTSPTGYNWTGSTWQADIAIVTGISSSENYDAPTVFQMNGEWYLISGYSLDAGYKGFWWNGATWETNTSIISGLPTVGESYTNPEVFLYDGTWYLLSGNNTGYFTGYNWTGSTWQGDTDIADGLGDQGVRCQISVFEMASGVVYAIAVDTSVGTLAGFNLTGSGAPVETYIPPDPTNLQNTSGDYWVNFTWDAGAGNVTDNYNILLNSTWHNATVNNYWNQTLSVCDYGNITVYGYNTTGAGTQSAGYVNDNVSMPCASYTPPDPTNLQNTSGDYWVNYTWDAGTGNMTDSYNILFNETWYNATSNNYFNQSIKICEWGNITVYAYNDTDEISTGSISDQIRMFCLWTVNNNIVSGLSVTDYATSSIFQMGSTWYFISGEYYGACNGFNWTGSTWQSDTTIVNGLPVLYDYFESTPNVFQLNSVWYCILGEVTGIYHGYNWTGTTWQSNSTIVNGLSDVGFASSCDVFEKDSITYLITGACAGTFTGYNWTGSGWQSDTAIVAGLSDVSENSRPTVFEIDSTWYLISGCRNLTDTTKDFFGFKWTGSAWESNDYIVSGLEDIGNFSYPKVFIKDNVRYLISGESAGGFYGYEIPVGVTPVEITLLSQTPSVIYQNSSGSFQLIWGISHDVAGINNSSVSAIWSIYDTVTGCRNHSIRPPSNVKAALLASHGNILRGDNRNNSLIFENNDTITGGNIYEWSGADKNTIRLNIASINNTYTKVYINGTIHGMHGNMYYLDRTDQQSATMTEQKIYKNHPLLIKIWDLEHIKGRTNQIVVGHLDTYMCGASTHGVDVYYLNNSFDPLGAVDPMDSPYLSYISSLNATDWVNYVHEIRNSRYIEAFAINESSLSVDINPTGYVYFTSREASQLKAFCCNITNSATITNRTFAQTNTLWTGDTAPLTAKTYTPNAFLSWRNTNRQFQTKLYAADNLDLWGNSTLHTSNIEVSLFPPTTPTISYFLFEGANDYDMIGTYYGTFDIGVGVSTDPDGGAVNHNLTLHYANQTFVTIINNTFTDDAATNAHALISFDSSPYYSNIEKYVLKVVATDNEDEITTTWSLTNFSLSAITNNPTNLQKTYVNFWVNWTWNEGTNGNHNIDSYNVSINNTWYNTTTNLFYNHTGLNISLNSSIIVWGFNNTIGLSPNSVSGVHTFALEKPSISLSLYSIIILIGLIFSSITVVMRVDPIIKIVTSSISGIIFLLSGITMFTTDINTYHHENTYLINTGWVGTLLIVLGVIMTIYTILLIYQVFTNEKITEHEYNGHG